jgi:hypothetical protein
MLAHIVQRGNVGASRNSGGDTRAAWKQKEIRSMSRPFCVTEGKDREARVEKEVRRCHSLGEKIKGFV